MQDLIATANVGSRHGLEGYLKVYSLSGEYDHLINLKKCVLRLRDGSEKEVSVESTKFSGPLFLMRFSLYDDPEKARVLSGSTIMVRREEAAKKEEGEIYVADLHGLSVTNDGKILGVVEATSDGAQALYLHVRTENGIRLVPYLPVYIGKVDLEKGTIEVKLTELLS